MRRVEERRRSPRSVAPWLATLWALLSPLAGHAYQSTTTMVAMSDGKQLATDVHRPDGALLRRPTVLIRTPYGKTHPVHFPVGLIEEYTDAGYNLVIQDTRGRFDSDGEDRVFFDDGWGANRDGYDTVVWIAGQPWHDGKLGTFGGSAQGITQYMLAGAAPPGLACQYVKIAASSLYHQAMRQGGGYRKALIESWLTAQGSIGILGLWEQHPFYDVFWQQLDLAQRWGAVNVPIFHVGGWYDIFNDGQITAFSAIQAHGGPQARGAQRLMMGPWTHEGIDAYSQQQGQLTYPANMIYDGVHALEWFDYCLKGVQNHFAGEQPVRYYVMGDVDDPQAPGNVWRAADGWPPLPTTTVELFLHADGTLDRRHPPLAAASTQLASDPLDPVPTVGGANLNLPAGPYDQSSIEGRADVLVFTSEPLPAPVEIVGRVAVRLWIAADVVDTDFVARLTDVYPDGRSMLVADAVLRAQHRNTVTAAEPLTPGEPVVLTVDLWSTAIAFNTGHRIRVSVAGSNYERFGVNPNTGAPFATDPTATQPASSTIFCDCEQPSALILPVTSGANNLGAVTPSPCAPDGGVVDAATDVGCDGAAAGDGGAGDGGAGDGGAGDGAQTTDRGGCCSVVAADGEELTLGWLALLALLAGWTRRRRRR